MSTSEWDFATLSQAVERPPKQLAADIQALPGGVGQVLDQVFAGMVDAFQPRKAGSQAAVVQYEIAGPDGATYPYVMRIADGKATWERGTADSPRVTIRMGLVDFLKLIVGKLKSMSAFMTGKLKVSGDLFFAQSYQNWFDRPD